MKNNWYVITGGPSTGKTSLLKELEKLGYKTIPEAARTVIDEALSRGISVEILRADEKRFQDDVAKLKEKIETTLKKSVVTFFDRGMQDTLAYMRYYSYELQDWEMELMKNAKYKKVFLLEPLATYESDYARTEDTEFAKNIQKLLFDAYSEFGMKPIILPALSLDDRVKFIIDKIKVEQKS
ncbi:MAG: ATP-binding protein [Candidatus Saccharibacteria bacterium]|nr:ATP-binding protein [Candidatus Saccharibacteria bacterium]